MKDAFDVLMITHAGLCKGYADALKLILDIDEDDFGTLSFENGESLDDFSEVQCNNCTIGKKSLHESL